MSTPLPRLYLLDVEGTVAPISFVYEQLFPYARAHFEEFLRQSLDELGRSGDDLERDDIAEGSVLRDILTLMKESRNETDPAAPKIMPDHVKAFGSEGTSSSFFTTMEFAMPRILGFGFWLMDRDRKATARKSLQGKIWKAGFESGELKGTLFPDVPEALARWAERAKVAIYSSGSVEAQRLLFRYSIFGDMTPRIAGYFDTRTGPKQASASYKAIAAAMKVEPGEVLFFSDVVRELDPAREAGCQTRLVVREGNAPVDDANGHSVVESFAVL